MCLGRHCRGHPVHVLLLELALEKESDQHLNNYRPGGGGSGSHGKGYEGSRPGQGTSPKHARIMENVKELFCTYDFSSCFPRKFKKSTKRGFSPEMTYCFGFYIPKIGGGGVLLPELCPKISKTLKFGLFWGIFACFGLVLQNSAAHQTASATRKVYSGFSTVFLSLLLLVAGVGFPAACFWR